MANVLAEKFAKHGKRQCHKKIQGEYLRKTYCLENSLLGAKWLFFLNMCEFLDKSVTLNVRHLLSFFKEKCGDHLTASCNTNFKSACNRYFRA